MTVKQPALMYEPLVCGRSRQPIASTARQVLVIAVRFCVGLLKIGQLRFENDIAGFAVRIEDDDRIAAID